jgi:hypothetical protein
VADGVWSDSSSAITSAFQEQSKHKSHPRAQKYINELNQTLGSTWREVDIAGRVLASQEPGFGVLNAGHRRPSKYQVGDYVYHYQPKTEPEGAPSKMC